ncbi:MAG: Amidohydrolase [Bacteroidetes bacterium ADurb.Bin217]|nr:MAG: Amidohydrolase [Bacteroidetes bacterium ADurb.Bin217]
MIALFFIKFFKEKILYLKCLVKPNTCTIKLYYMNSIPIFDSLTHPTIDSHWILPKYHNSANIENLVCQMKQYNIIKSFAVGMYGIGSYEQNSYYKLIKPYSDYFYSIAFLLIEPSDTEKTIKEKLKRVKETGFKGVKLHPRFSDFSISNPLIVYTIKIANELELTILFCTYFYHPSRNACSNSIESLLNVLLNTQDCKIILLHAGTVRLMEMIEIARSFKNILLDLSFTLCKYEGSSIDLDIQFAFNTFDQRVCIGSDFPEFSMQKLRERFNNFAKNLSEEKARNIGYKNLESYIQ